MLYKHSPLLHIFVISYIALLYSCYPKLSVDFETLLPSYSLARSHTVFIPLNVPDSLNIALRYRTTDTVSSNMHRTPYIVPFADLMASGMYETIDDCTHAIVQLHEEIHRDIGDLRNGNTEFPIGDRTWWKLDLLLCQAQQGCRVLLGEMQVEIAHFSRNMRILYQEYEAKYQSLYEKHGTHEAAEKILGNDVIESGNELEDYVQGMNEQPWHKDYLTDIFRFWRRYGGKHDHEPFEEVWRWVAGRPLPHLEKTATA